ncbi:tRNA (guanine-N1)-methyltransferase [Bizionia sediminis]|uniref:tRNA (Guanine-N1)-methyltransferase n=1 Tax=Bizionia sediminis TaxID=1737064 RepID=A0ABW5KX67_9FLAO
MKTLKKFGFLITLLSIIQLQAQNQSEADQLSLENGTLDNQFEYVIQRSNNYQDYKVVKKNWLYTLKANTLDSLKSIHSELANAQAKITKHESEINTLQTNLDDTIARLQQTTNEKNNMEMFGLQFTKPNYNLVMWSLVALLFFLLLLFVYKFKNSHAITRQAQKNLLETEAEFEEHRRIALEREQKVRRQLQDEINKQKGTS